MHTGRFRRRTLGAAFPRQVNELRSLKKQRKCTFLYRKRRKQDKNNEGRGRREKGVWLERRRKRAVDKRK